jgi:hypothetical protein
MKATLGAADAQFSSEKLFFSLVIHSGSLRIASRNESALYKSEVRTLSLCQPDKEQNNGNEEVKESRQEISQESTGEEKRKEDREKIG